MTVGRCSVGTRRAAWDKHAAWFAHVRPWPSAGSPTTCGGRTGDAWGQNVRIPAPQAATGMINRLQKVRIADDSAPICSDLRSTPHMRHTCQVALTGSAAVRSQSWGRFKGPGLRHDMTPQSRRALQARQMDHRTANKVTTSTTHSLTEPCAPCERGRSTMPAPPACAVGATRPTAWTGGPGQMNSGEQVSRGDDSGPVPPKRHHAPGRSSTQAARHRTPDSAATTQKDGKRGGTEDPHQAQGL
jgi:hypothetical protein